MRARETEWREIIGHDFTPEDWTELQAGAERLVMESRTLAEMPGKPPVQVSGFE